MAHPASCDWSGAAGVNPDVTPHNPQALLSVTYHGHQKVQPGQVMLVKDTQIQPTLDWPLQPAQQPNTNALYTIVMCDPDAPSRADPKYRCWLHWLVVNVVHPSSIGEGYEITPHYQGPAPPPKTGLHRYCFLVYKQSGVFDVSKLAKVAENKRGGWQLKDFLKDHAATIPDGPPIAGNYFQAQNETQ